MLKNEVKMHTILNHLSPSHLKVNATYCVGDTLQNPFPIAITSRCVRSPFANGRGGWGSDECAMPHKDTTLRSFFVLRGGGGAEHDSGCKPKKPRLP